MEEHEWAMFFWRVWRGIGGVVCLVGVSCLLWEAFEGLVGGLVLLLFFSCA